MTPTSSDITAFGIAGVGELRPGDDLAAVLVSALAAAGQRLLAGDLLVVSSKAVSKVEGRFVPAAERDAAVAAQTVRVVARRRAPAGLAQVVQAVAGPVMAAAGVDNSNVEPGQVLLLPADPDGSARALRARLAALGVTGVGVLLSDTAGRAWRDGQVDFALGAAGIRVTDDLRGAPDTHGQPMQVTVRALADEVAALADLVKGKLTGLPAAVVRGLGHIVQAVDGPGATALLRPAAEDWFRLGHVEAVRACLGLDVAAHDPPSVLPETVEARLARVVEMAFAAGGPWPGRHDVRQAAVDHGARASFRCRDAASLGAFAQRLSALAWSENLRLTMTMDDDTLDVGAADLA